MPVLGIIIGPILGVSTSSSIGSKYQPQSNTVKCSTS